MNILDRAANDALKSRKFVTINVNGSIRLSTGLVTDMHLTVGDFVIITEDKDHFTIEKAYNGFKLRKAGGRSPALMFNASGIARRITEVLGLDFGGHSSVKVNIKKNGKTYIVPPPENAGGKLDGPS